MTLTKGYKSDANLEDDWFKAYERILTVINGSGGTGIEPSDLSTNLQKGFYPINLFESRVIVSNDFQDETITSTGGSEKASGGILAVDGAIFSLARVNGATDKAARVVFKGNTTGELQLPTVPIPHDLDDSSDVTIHLMTEMAGATDTPTIDVQVFAGKGDTEMGGATAALSNSLEEKSVTLTAANIPAHPSFLNIALVPAAHTTDAIWLYAAWMEYTKKA